MQPSPKAWERIQEQLETSRKPRPKPYNRYVMAASFAGILLASIIYLATQRTEVGPPMEVTDVEVDEAPQKAVEETPGTDPIIGEDVPAEVAGHKGNAATKGADTDEAEVSDSWGEELVSVDKTEGVAKEPVVLVDAPKTLIDAKVDEIVTKIEGLEKDEVAVSDAEIDELLRAAQREIILEGELGKNGRTVDAMALLADVEYEIDQSFRDQIFEALKERLLKVRTAVATRNE